MGKSKKRSDSKHAPPDAVFFVDEGLGRYDVAEPLRQAGYLVVCHHELFRDRQGVPDEEWLPVVAEKRYLVLSKDDRIRLNPGQKAILMEAGVRAFFLNRADASGPIMADAFLIAAPRMLRMARSEPRASWRVFTRTERSHSSSASRAEQRLAGRPNAVRVVVPAAARFGRASIRHTLEQQREAGRDHDAAH